MRHSRRGHAEYNKRSSLPASSLPPAFSEGKKFAHTLEYHGPCLWFGWVSVFPSSPLSSSVLLASFHALPAVILVFPHPTALPPAGPQILILPVFTVPVTMLLPHGLNATLVPGQAETTLSSVPSLARQRRRHFSSFVAKSSPLKEASMMGPACPAFWLLWRFLSAARASSVRG
jgi:hypothetical protein